MSTLKVLLSRCGRDKISVIYCEPSTTTTTIPVDKGIPWPWIGVTVAVIIGAVILMRRSNRGGGKDKMR